MRKKATAWQYIKQYKFRSLLLRNFAFIIFMMILPLAIVIGSGYGKLEEALFDLLSEIDAQLYIIDCMPNLSGKKESAVVYERTLKGVK